MFAMEPLGVGADAAVVAEGEGASTGAPTFRLPAAIAADMQTATMRTAKAIFFISIFVAVVDIEK